MNYNKKFKPEVIPDEPDLRINELIELFGTSKFLTGSHIVRYMNLANELYWKNPSPLRNTDIVDEFFTYFCDNNILKPNMNINDTLWIQNYYTLNKDFVKTLTS